MKKIIISLIFSIALTNYLQSAEIENEIPQIDAPILLQTYNTATLMFADINSRDFFATNAVIPGTLTNQVLVTFTQGDADFHAIRWSVNNLTLPQLHAIWLEITIQSDELTNLPYVGLEPSNVVAPATINQEDLNEG